MYGNIKQLVLDATGLGPDALHTLGGLACFFVFWAVTRRLWQSVIALLSLQAMNEAADILDDIIDRKPIQIIDGIVDTVFTVTIPLLLALLHQFFLRRKRRSHTSRRRRELF